MAWTTISEKAPELKPSVCMWSQRAVRLQSSFSSAARATAPAWSGVAGPCEPQHHWIFPIVKSMRVSMGVRARCRHQRGDGRATEAVVGDEGFRVEEAETRGRQVAELTLQDGPSHKAGLSDFF
ncbi:hypothetical protein ACFXTH_046444 [Malus domestica]